MEDNIGNDREAAIIIFVFKKTPPARRSGGTIGAGVFFFSPDFAERTSSISHHTSSIFPCPCTLQSRALYYNREWWFYRTPSFTVT